MNNVVHNQVCPRCDKPFQVTAKKGHYARKYCSAYCSKHFHGKPLERFFKKVNKNGPLILDTPCWQWTGAVANDGYANFRDDGYITGHKWAYQKFVGPVPKGLILRHRCDNAACVRPDHLETGTLADNSQDCLKRSKKKFGSVKLNPDQVRQIREALGRGDVKWKRYEEVGKDFGVGACTIYAIHIGRTWKWVA